MCSAWPRLRKASGPAPFLSCRLTAQSCGLMTLSAPAGPSLWVRAPIGSSAAGVQLCLCAYLRGRIFSVSPMRHQASLCRSPQAGSTFVSAGPQASPPQPQGPPSTSAAVSQPSPCRRRLFGSCSAAGWQAHPLSPTGSRSHSLALLLLPDLTATYHGQAPLLSRRGPGHHLPSLRGPPNAIAADSWLSPCGHATLGAARPQAAWLTLRRPLAPQPLPSPFPDSQSSLPPRGPCFSCPQGPTGGGGCRRQRERHQAPTHPSAILGASPSWICFKGSLT
ncbi:hypothetical protein NDU88_001433 [Pleurodeles waltl]|uniref:Uncharacterized protein n=1 Tax=Pleurodeles waltl TaxID=8319 RepID=A0AAV7VAY9_PLEWA|nr:hypothetical protein NDU88_001433 [Pleurodeles waltl]